MPWPFAFDTARLRGVFTNEQSIAYLARNLAPVVYRGFQREDDTLSLFRIHRN